jgi:hypothetical protein
MPNNRIYDRYEISYGEDQNAPVEIIVEGEFVHLVNFSLGGLYFLSEQPFSMGDIVNLSIDLENRGTIDLMGKIIRVNPESDRWGNAIDLSHTYNLKPLRKT